MAQPIIFTITKAGKQAALNAATDAAALKINLTEVGLGAGKYAATGNETALANELKRSSIVSGDVELASHTLRFSSSMTADTVTDVYELGLFTDDNVLFAVVSSTTDPLFTLHPDITFVGSFGLSLTDVAKDSVTVTTDPNGALSITLMQQHLAAPDPHPQYLNHQRFLQFLQLAYPYGHKYWTHSKSNPKPLFDAMFGFETHWRRLEGVGLVAVKDGDTFIGQPMLTLGQHGTTDLATTERPHTYPIYTSYLFERYNPDDVIETVWQVNANKTAITEGAAVRFTVTANNLPDGQVLNWSVKEGALNSASNDITSPDKSDSGTVILRNGQAVIDFITSADDNTVEPQKHVRLTVGAPANLSINVPINDAGKNETVVHITQSTTNGLVLDEYYKQQSGAYPSATDKVRFIVDTGVDIVAPDTATPAITDGANWPTGSQIIVENRGRILGRGGDGGRSAYSRTTGNPSAGSTTPPEKGGDGGTAIKSLARAISIENHNIVAGGGGGGGGLGAYKTAGEFNFVVGGGGTGGGAPYGKRSPNEGTYSMYLIDTATASKKLPMPSNGIFYKILRQDTDQALANWPGSEGDYHYDASYYASSASDQRYIFVEIKATSVSQAVDSFREYRVSDWTGSNTENSIKLTMSQDAGLNSAGLGGSGLSMTPSSYFATRSGNYPISDNPTLTQGGSGGAFGQNGQSGIFDKIYNYTGAGEATETTSDNTSWYIPPAAGGLAGYIKEGSVTITNYGSGTTKGR